MTPTTHDLCGLGSLVAQRSAFFLQEQAARSATRGRKGVGTHAPICSALAPCFTRCHGNCPKSFYSARSLQLSLPASGLLILLIDRQPRGAYFVANLGANPVKLLRWAISVLEISFVCFALIVPRVDDPATAFDETDSPVNVTAPLVARTNLVLPARHSVAIPGERRGPWKPCTTIYGLTPEPGIYSSHSLLYLLCKLLC